MKEHIELSSIYTKTTDNAEYASAILQNELNVLMPEIGAQVMPYKITVDGPVIHAEVRINMTCRINNNMPREMYHRILREHAKAFRLKMIKTLKQVSPTILELGIFGSPIWMAMIENRMYVVPDGNDSLRAETSINDKEWQR